MKKIFFLMAILMACNQKSTTLHLKGTWKLINGTFIEKGDTSVTDYTQGQSFIKIINDTHFAFLKHSFHKDSLNDFIAGGGKYNLKGNKYTEHLEYCNDKPWEGQSFEFEVNIINDTLTQIGIEKIETEGIDRWSIEKYVREK